MSTERHEENIQQPIGVFDISRGSGDDGGHHEILFLVEKHTKQPSRQSKKKSTIVEI